MALILNIETSSPKCSVALSLDGKLIESESSFDKQDHASSITIIIQKLFEKSSYKLTDIDAVAVSKGPGSYTGLRIGVSTAKGLCYALNKPLIAVCTLQAMAWAISESNHFDEGVMLCPMLDARRMEVYCGVYDIHNSVHLPVDALIIDENSFSELLLTKKVVFFGSGAEKCKNVMTHQNAVFIPDFIPLAKNMICLSEKSYQASLFEDVAYFEPYYLKDFIITTPKNKVLGNNL